MTELPPLRAFIAIPLPQALQQRLGSLQQLLRQQLPELRTPRPETLHLTLHFLGEQPQPLLAEIGRLMLSIGEKQKTFNVELKQLGCFPNLKRPRVLWLGIEPATELIALQRQLGKLLERAGLTPERRSYRPHLTLGRFRRQPADPGALRPFLSHQCGNLQIDRMVLYSSRLTAQGAQHSPLATVSWRQNSST